MSFVTTPCDLLRQREHRELAAERRVVAQRRVSAHGAEAVGRVGQPGRKADAGPAAHARANSDVLPAAVLAAHHVADYAGRSLELVEFLARLGIDRLEITFQRAVEHDAARGRQRAGPDRELLLLGPHDLAGLAVPGE